jgi:hypothetical protein
MENEISTFPVNMMMGDGTEQAGAFTCIDVVATEPDKVQLILEVADSTYTAVAYEYFSAMSDIRHIIEPLGMRLLCYGSSRNCYPSAMQLDMGYGTWTYKLAFGQPGLKKDIVSIFDSGNDVIPATCAEQRFYFRLWGASVTHGAGDSIAFYQHLLPLIEAGGLRLTDERIPLRFHQYLCDHLPWVSVTEDSLEWERIPHSTRLQLDGTISDREATAFLRTTTLATYERVAILYSPRLPCVITKFEFAATHPDELLGYRHGARFLCGVSGTSDALEFHYGDVVEYDMDDKIWLSGILRKD